MIPSIPSIPSVGGMGRGVVGVTIWVPVFAGGLQVFADGLPVMVPLRFANA